MTPGAFSPDPLFTDQLPSRYEELMANATIFVFTHLAPEVAQDGYHAFFAELHYDYLAEVVASFDAPTIEIYSDSLPDEKRTQFQTFMDAATDAFWRLSAADDEDCDCAAVPDGFADQMALAYKMQACSDRLLAQIGGARRIKVQGRHRRTTNYAIAG